MGPHGETEPQKQTSWPPPVRTSSTKPHKRRVRRHHLSLSDPTSKLAHRGHPTTTHTTSLHVGLVPADPVNLPYGWPSRNRPRTGSMLSKSGNFNTQDLPWPGYEFPFLASEPWPKKTFLAFWMWVRKKSSLHLSAACGPVRAGGGFNPYLESFPPNFNQNSPCSTRNIHFDYLDLKGRISCPTSHRNFADLEARTDTPDSCPNVQLSDPFPDALFVLPCRTGLKPRFAVLLRQERQDGGFNFAFRGVSVNLRSCRPQIPLLEMSSKPPRVLRDLPPVDGAQLQDRVLCLELLHRGDALLPLGFRV